MEVLHTILMWLSWSHFLLACINGLESDISCLKSIKESLEDPFNSLSSWNFSDTTEGWICRFTGVDCWHLDENKVLNIRLSDMGLRGQFPRGIANCSAIVGLDLSSNQLFGPIPSDINDILNYVTSLDLSSNNFSGEIPPAIANCSYLNVLKLDNNQLTGQIPRSLGQITRLKTFSVANNRLSGPVPDFMNDNGVSAESLANNEGLCGSPLPSCNNDNYRTFFISGFAIGWSVFTPLVFALSWCYLPDIRLNKFMSNRKKKKSKAVVQDTTQWWPTELNASEDSKIFEMEKLVTRITFTELANATNNFSEANIIKSGKTGTSYKAVLPNGWFLVIQRFHPLQCSEEHFVSELTILEGDLNIMKWPLRVKIAVGLARGLAWLHYNRKLRVFHHSISSKCVLLDQNWVPKISNFGDATFMNPNETSSVRSFSINESVVDNSLIGLGFDSEIFQFLSIARKCVEPFPDQRPTMPRVYQTMRAIGEKHGLVDDF
ncbi:hypothetical protein Acr_00g0098850 [Actinidia rufa]|uniref:Protein kinase domain-containing protein n=1 Tax=Actinidia rufa TaxID=165716 RepID=A0A7J0DZP4_9ERIC|nr:hypothetical protein Acr_00g0098850 [Actinidia rufa]